jgi:hypothetical protein
LVGKYATVARLATKMRGQKKKPSHHKNPPVATDEKSRVRRGNIAIKMRKKTPWRSQKLMVPKFILKTSIISEVATRRTKKMATPRKAMFFIGGW